MRSACTCLSLVLLWLFAGQGCASAHRGDAFQPEVADSSKAVIYIFRQSRGLSSRPADVYINQRHEGELAPGQYLARVVPPGEYFVRAADNGEAVRQVVLRAGDTVYFRIQTSRFGRILDMDLPEAAEARELIARTGRAP
jgi:hypothetical protein